MGKEEQSLQRTQAAYTSPHPGPTKSEALFRLETDASGYATGVVLSQLSEDDKWICGFTSRASISQEELCNP